METSNCPEKYAEELRQRAKENLNKIFQTPEGVSSGQVESIVDDIIMSAVFKVAELQQKSIKQSRENK